MLKSGTEKVVLKQGLIILVLLVGIYIFFLSPFLKEGRSMMDEELERKISEMKRFIMLTGAVPSKESFAKMEKDRDLLKEKFLDLKDFIDPDKTRISEKNSEAGLYFIEKLHSTMKKFEIEAGEKKVKLPDGLGFGDGLPKDNMVPMLLRQLETIEFAVGTLLKNEGVYIYTLKPLKPVEYIEPVSKKLFYTELPVQISIKTTTNVFMNFLLELKNASPAIGTKELHVKSITPDSGDVEISLVLSSFMVNAGIVYEN